MVFVFFGPPGSGKGTQAQYLVKKYGFRHISTGQLLRQEIQNKTALGLDIKSHIEAGELVSDDVMLELVKNVFKDKNSEHVIFDGFPRTVHQAIAFEDILSVNNLRVDLVINFEVSFDHLLERVKGRLTCKTCGHVYHEINNPPIKTGVCDFCHGVEFEKRNDDEDSALKRRFELYKTETQTVKDFYSDRGIVVSIDASLAVETVKKNVEKALADLGIVS